MCSSSLVLSKVATIPEIGSRGYNIVFEDRELLSFSFSNGLDTINFSSKVMSKPLALEVESKSNTLLTMEALSRWIYSRGTYGLWLDADLYHGRTCPSKTFDNVRLSAKEDFIIASVEVWTFVDWVAIIYRKQYFLLLPFCLIFLNLFKWTNSTTSVSVCLFSNSCIYAYI